MGPVYQLAWSCDSRLLASASKDSTLKVSCLICCKAQHLRLQLRTALRRYGM